MFAKTMFVLKVCWIHIRLPTNPTNSQKCNTRQYMDNPSRKIKFSQWYSTCGRVSVCVWFMWYCTSVPMNSANEWTLQLIAFDEYYRFPQYTLYVQGKSLPTITVIRFDIKVWIFSSAVSYRFCSFGFVVPSQIARKSGKFQPKAPIS